MSVSRPFRKYSDPDPDGVTSFLDDDGGWNIAEVAEGVAGSRRVVVIGVPGRRGVHRLARAVGPTKSYTLAVGSSRGASRR